MVEFVVGFRLAPRVFLRVFGFFSGYSGFSPGIRVFLRVFGFFSGYSGFSPGIRVFLRVFGFFSLLKNQHIQIPLRPYSYPRNWTRTSLQGKLMWGNIIKKRLMLFVFEKTPCISLTCKLVPVQNRIYEYSPTSIKRPPIKRPPSIKRPLSKVPIYLSVNCCT